MTRRRQVKLANNHFADLQVTAVADLRADFVAAEFGAGVDFHLVI